MWHNEDNNRPDVRHRDRTRAVEKRLFTIIEASVYSASVSQIDDNTDHKW